MTNRPLFFAGIFSLGIHALLASLLIPFSLKATLEKSFSLEVVWEKQPSFPSLKGKPGNSLKEEEKKIVKVNQSTAPLKPNLHKISIPKGSEFRQNDESRSAIN